MKSKIFAIPIIIFSMFFATAPQVAHSEFISCSELAEQDLAKHVYKLQSKFYGGDFVQYLSSHPTLTNGRDDIVCTSPKPTNYNNWVITAQDGFYTLKNAVTGKLLFNADNEGSSFLSRMLLGQHEVNQHEVRTHPYIENRNKVEFLFSKITPGAVIIRCISTGQPVQIIPNENLDDGYRVQTRVVTTFDESDHNFDKRIVWYLLKEAI